MTITPKNTGVQLPYQYRLFPIAGAALAYVKDRNLEILAANFADVLFAKISVKYRKILGRAWKDVIGAKRAVPKSGVLRRDLGAATPLTCDDRFAWHVMVNQP